MRTWKRWTVGPAGSIIADSEINRSAAEQETHQKISIGSVIIGPRSLGTILLEGGNYWTTSWYDSVGNV